MFKNPIVYPPFQAPGCRYLCAVPMPDGNCSPLAVILAQGLHLQVLIDLLSLSLGGKAQADQNTQHEGGEPHG